MPGRNRTQRDISRKIVSGLRLGVALGVLAILSACGGGSGGEPISTPAPAPPPSPTPSPTPTPTPAPTPPPTNFDTAEYRRSDGPDYHNAITAWEQGATGEGVKLAVVDSGIDTDSPEFAGRIDPASADVAGNGTIEDVDGHGTQVTLVAAAARNNSGVMGIAFDSTILTFRADDPGSCASANASDPASGCTFDDRSIASGINRAVSAGATVINLSLGSGDGPSATLTQAIRNASAAGVVIIVSAGNEGDGSDPTIDPNNPNGFASGVRAAGGANVIIAGSVDKQGRISDFSNRAGNDAAYYLTALGEGICCEYKDGEIHVQTDASGQYVLLEAGTSFSAPQIAGAVALLKQAFPNLTGSEMVRILLDSATDLGATGVDATYGNGTLNIAAAFAPQGRTAMAGEATAMPLGDDTAIASAAMGDALAGASLRAIVLDGYSRAYNVDLGARMQVAHIAPRLTGALESGSRRHGVQAKGVSLAFSVAGGARATAGWVAPLRLTREEAQQARVLAARAAMRIAPDTQIGFAFQESSDGLVAQLQGQEQPAFLIAGNARGDSGFAHSTEVSFAVRHKLGQWGFTASGDSGEAWLGDVRYAANILSRQRERYRTQSLSFGADRRFGAIDTTLALTWQGEERTVLGAYLADAFGGGGARTLFIDAEAGWRFAEGWRLGGGLRQGWTRADRSGLVVAGSHMVSRAWSLDLQRDGVFARQDRVGLRLSQPLRVESGGLTLRLPVAYDYNTLGVSYGNRTLALSPYGREIDGEIAWSGPLWGGSASASLFYRKDPGHVATLADDAGMAVRWSTIF
ncbi:peptidase S8 [Tsuneonella suprasediminis]|uniref:Peptidase S8 n=1 Tax=Tsuneonella suprasediminis TaxID=2306996 RepID=A0A419QZS9_9SPHN|nr:S8 family peptidase [Tsuneonella suprasediminis]RJX66696.1 peptidase S8 [Tsuneonella suprasediminis]